MTAEILQVAIAMFVSFLLGTWVGSTLTWRQVRVQANHLMAEALETQLPKDVFKLVAMVATRLDTRFTALVACNEPDEMMVAVAARHDVTRSEEMALLAAATRDLNAAVERRARETEERSKTTH